MNKYLVIGFLSLSAIIIALFEFIPMVEHYRFNIPLSIYETEGCGCYCISESRPWYSTFNYWFWFWVSFVPIFIFSIKPGMSKWHRILGTIVAIGFCYGIMNLGTSLKWDISGGPFVIHNIDYDVAWWRSDIASKKSLECANTSNGANLAFMLLLGWIPATIYYGWWLTVWYSYHKRISKKIDKETYKEDWFHTLVMIAGIIPNLLMIVALGVVTYVGIFLH